MIGPALPLSLLVGIFHTALSVFIRGSVGARAPLTFAAAVLGAWAGDSLAARIGLDVLVLGDYRLLGASLGSWLGIGIVAALAVLGPDPRFRLGRGR